MFSRWCVTPPALRATSSKEEAFSNRLLFRGDARQGRGVSPGERCSPVGVSLLRHFVPPPLKRRLSQIVSSLEEMPDRAEESARANMIRPLVYHSSGTSCHLLYKRRLSQIVSSLEEMPDRAEESARANTVRPYGGDDTFSTYLSDFTSICAKNSSLRLLLTEHPPPFSREANYRSPCPP